MGLHKKHQIQILGGFLEELVAPVKLPLQLAKEEKDVDGLIGTLIAELNNIRLRHQYYVTNYAQNHRRFAGLIQKVLHGEQLEVR